MSEIADAVQIIRVSFDGIEIAMKVGSGSIKTMQNAVKFLYGMLNYEKQMGKTNMRKLLMRGGDLQVLQFAQKDMKQVEKFAKKYGILYSVLPELGKDSGRVEVLFHSEAVPRVNLLLQKLNKGSYKMRSVDTFLGEADDQELAVFDKYLQDQKKGNLDVHVDANLHNLIEKVGQYAVKKKSVSVDEIGENLSVDRDSIKDALEKLAKIGVVDTPDDKGQYRVMMDRETFEDKIKRFKELSERMKCISASKNTNLSDVTIAKSLIAEENERAIKTRIPGTWGDKARYVWINKSDVMEIYGGKTLLSFLDREKTYKLYTEDNRVVETVKGEILYKNHYDPVSKGVRERYEKSTTKTRNVTPQRKLR